MLNNQSTDTTTQLDEIRRQRSQEFFSADTNKVVDNDTNNSYNGNNPVKESTEGSQNQQSVMNTGGQLDDENAKYAKAYEETFGGDALKAVKSWSKSQSEYQKLRQEANVYKTGAENLAFLEQKLSEKPKIFEIVKKVIDGEEIDENLLFGQKEALVAKPSDVVNKLGHMDVDLTEDSLSQSGHLDIKLKSAMSQLEWDRYVLQVQQRVMPSLIGERAAKEAMARIEHEQSKKQQEVQRSEAHRLNNERIEKGLETAALSYGLDFTGEHKDIVDTVLQRATMIRDPKDPANLISPNAVRLALIEVAEETGIPLTTISAPTNKANNLFDQANPNRSTSVAKNIGQKLSVEEERILKKRQKNWDDAKRVSSLFPSRQS